MTWVTCQSVSSGETFAVNTRLVKRVVDRSNCAVIEFIDGTQYIVKGGLQEWYSEIDKLTSSAEVRQL